MRVYEAERDQFLNIAQQQSGNYEILFPSLALAIVKKYELKEIDEDFIKFTNELLVEAVPDKEKYFNNDATILRDSLSNKREGKASFDNRYEFINLLLVFARDIEDINSFNKDIVKFYNYFVKNQLDYNDEFIGICAYLNVHPKYAEGKLEEIAQAQQKFKIHFDL